MPLRLDAATARKLLAICRPFKPDMAYELGPNFPCATEETLKAHGFHVASLRSLPKSAYEGKDVEVRSQEGEIAQMQDVHVFLRDGLERLAGVPKETGRAR